MLHQTIATKGFVTDAIVDDFDQDGTHDLIVVGEWMAPLFLKNNKDSFKPIETPSTTGLWQSIIAFDIDKDGDNDYLLGNWGLNSKFKASAEEPLLMHYGDFDKNGKTETLISVAKNGNYYPIASLDDLASQMVSLRKKFNNYSSFAGKTIDDIFDKKVLESSEVLSINTLASGYLANTNGKFVFVPFAETLQISPLTAFVAFDFNNDGKEEVLAGGNYFGTKPYHGRFDSFPGALIFNQKDSSLGGDLGLDFTQKSLRHLDVLTVNNKNYLLAVYNNQKTEIYHINKKK